MSFTCSIDRSGPVPLVVAAGPAGLPELCGLVHLVGQACKPTQARLLLADLGEVEPKLSFTEHLQVGVTASSQLAQFSHIAAVVPAGYLDAPAARAAQLAGLHVRTFLVRADAAAWLQAVQASPGGALRAGTSG